MRSDAAPFNERGNPFLIARSWIHPSLKWKKTNISFTNLCYFRRQTRSGIGGWGAETSAAEAICFSETGFWGLCRWESGFQSRPTISHLCWHRGHKVKILTWFMINWLFCTVENYSLYVTMVHGCVFNSLPPAPPPLMPFCSQIRHLLDLKCRIVPTSWIFCEGKDLRSSAASSPKVSVSGGSLSTVGLVFWATCVSSICGTV